MTNGIQIARKMPKQKPGLSRQNYQTPKDFIDAVKHRWGFKAFTYDLAAETENSQAKHFFTKEEDSLSKEWWRLRGSLWLNPPFAHIEPWAKKCWETIQIPNPTTGPRIFFLVPAGVGADWFAKWVDQKAAVYFLNGRLSFDGIAPYPKDCLMACYGERAGYEVWRWK